MIRILCFLVIMSSVLIADINPKVSGDILYRNKLGLGVDCSLYSIKTWLGEDVLLPAFGLNYVDNEFRYSVGVKVVTTEKLRNCYVSFKHFPSLNETLIGLSYVL